VDCRICDHPIVEEESHDYHEPSCAVIRGAWTTEHESGHTVWSVDCRCDGQVHPWCCSVCFVSDLLQPVHKFLYDRENA
jgi:hypothetical protein